MTGTPTAEEIKQLEKLLDELKGRKGGVIAQPGSKTHQGIDKDTGPRYQADLAKAAQVLKDAGLGHLLTPRRTKVVRYVRPAKPAGTALGRRGGHEYELNRFLAGRPLTVDLASEWLLHRSPLGTDTYVQNELMVQVLQGKLTPQEANQKFNAPVKKYDIFKKDGSLPNWWQTQVPTLYNFWGQWRQGIPSQKKDYPDTSPSRSNLRAKFFAYYPELTMDNIADFLVKNQHMGGGHTGFIQTSLGYAIKGEVKEMLREYEEQPHYPKLKKHMIGTLKHILDRLGTPENLKVTIITKVKNEIAPFFR